MFLLVCNKLIIDTWSYGFLRNFHYYGVQSSGVSLSFVKRGSNQQNIRRGANNIK